MSRYSCVSDASDIACGSYVIKGNNSVFHSNWSERGESKKIYFKGASSS